MTRQTRDMNQWTGPEKKIYELMQEVEEWDAHPSLTDAVIALGEAREHIAEYDRSRTTSECECPVCGDALEAATYCNETDGAQPTIQGQEGDWTWRESENASFPPDIDRKRKEVIEANKQSTIDQLTARVAEQGLKLTKANAVIQVLAELATDCPKDVKCRRKIDTPSDVYQSCVDCRKEWAEQQVKQANGT